MKRRKKRQPRRLQITFEQLLEASPKLKQFHDQWSASGYQVSHGRLYACQDGTYTVRIVWRSRTSLVSTVCFTLRGFVL